MSKTITLPSGNTAVLRDPSTLRVKDRKKVVAAANGQEGLLQAMSMTDGLIAVLIESWSFDLIIPSIHLASLDELSLPPSSDTASLEFPIEEDFQAGVIGFTWEATTSRVIIELQAMTEVADQELFSADADFGDIEDPPDLVRVSLRLFQVRGFCDRAEAVVAGGRQPCPFCGLPINVEGHLCPRAKGYRR